MFCPSPIYIQVTSHINPGPNICIAHPSRWGLSLMCVTYPSRSWLTCIQIPVSLSHLHPCTVSLPPRSEVSCLHLHPCDISPPAYSLPFKSWYLHHSSIHILSHTNPRFNVSTWTPSRSRLTSIQIPWLAFHIHPSLPSTTSCCISIPARSHLNPIQVSGWASHLHSCPGSPPFSFL